MALFLEHQEGGRYPPIYGEIMAKVMLKERSVKPIVMRYGGETYEVNGVEPVEMPLGFAINILGSREISVELTEADKKDLIGLSDYKRTQLVPHYDVEEEDDGKTMAEKLFGKSRSFFKSKPKAEKPVKEEVKEEVEEPVEEEKLLKPLPEDLSTLTVKQLKVLLEERNLSTDGKKADLIETLSEVEE